MAHLTELQKYFSLVAPTITLRHSKIIQSLLNGEPKTANELSKESEISHNHIYKILTELIDSEIVQTKGSPKQYFIQDINKIYQQKIEETVNTIYNQQAEFYKSLEKIKKSEETEFTIKIKNGQVKIYDSKTKTLIKTQKDLAHLKRIIDKIETKNQWITTH